MTGTFSPLMARLIHGSLVSFGALVASLAAVAVIAFIIWFPWYRPPRK